MPNQCSTPAVCLNLILCVGPGNLMDRRSASAWVMELQDEARLYQVVTPEPVPSHRLFYKQLVGVTGGEDLGKVDQENQ